MSLKRLNRLLIFHLLTMVPSLINEWQYARLPFFIFFVEWNY